MKNILIKKAKIDTTETNVMIKKAKKLRKILKEANALADELASKNLLKVDIEL